MSVKAIQTVHGVAETVKVEAPALVLLDKEVIKNNQNTIKSSLIGLDVQIHDNAVQCLLHCREHRDTSLMRRLLVEIVGKDSGYRRQGLIAWMRTYSPMELKGDNINLSGKDADGKERPFRVEEANANPFRSDKKFDEKAIPVYIDSLFGKLDAADREFRAALSNTKDGKPIDKSKKFFDGQHTDQVLNFFEEVEKLRAKLPSDNTKEVREAEATIAKAQAMQASA